MFKLTTFLLVTLPSLATAQVDTAGWAAWEQLMNTRMRDIYYRPLESCAVSVEWPTGSDNSMRSIQVNTIDQAVLMLREELEHETAERILDFLDSASTLFYMKGTPVRLLSGGYHASIRNYIEEERKTGVIHLFVLGGCVRFGREADAIRVFNQRTDLLLDTLDRSVTEARMRALRMELSTADAPRKGAEWSLWSEEKIKLPNSCAQITERRRSRYLSKGHRWISQVKVTELDCCGQKVKFKRYTENANAWKVRIEGYHEKVWTSRCSLF